MMSFLKAQWRDLILINYEVDPKILEPFLPAGVEMDLWNGKCYASLVAFMFRDVRILGIPVPGHVNFEEINLRFYVKRNVDGAWRRGVVFLKEIVPKRAIALIANLLYKEHYSKAKMGHSAVETEDRKIWTYHWFDRTGSHEVSMTTGKEPHPIQAGSEAEFITEHYYGYTRVSDRVTFEYEVTHPRWTQLDVLGYKTDVNFEKAYGLPFSFMATEKPASVLFAEGSKITVERYKRLILP